MFPYGLTSRSIARPKANSLKWRVENIIAVCTAIAISISNVQDRLESQRETHRAQPRQTETQTFRIGPQRRSHLQIAVSLGSARLG